MLKAILSAAGVYKLYEKWLGYQVGNGSNGSKPEHIAIILDGNRRWANARAMNSWMGHHFGAAKVKALLDWCLDLNVKSVTIYAFSTENFMRAPDEVEEIMRLAEDKFREILTDERIHRNRVRVKVIGRVAQLPKGLQELILDVEQSTRDYDQHFLNIALAYGGRAEILDATRQIAEKIEKGDLKADAITEDMFESYLYTAHLPKQEPDLIIRTSGEERLSGFLLWQSAYSELCFLDVYWPDFRRIDLLRAVRTYQKRKRRYGQ
jgi:tritrans,polycis-undecaprenyl-diphosphate synthase [geranylgeranyl-diphosphate specific]